MAQSWTADCIAFRSVGATMTQPWATPDSTTQSRAGIVGVRTTRCKSGFGENTEEVSFTRMNLIEMRSPVSPKTRYTPHGCGGRIEINLISYRTIDLKLADLIVFVDVRRRRMSRFAKTSNRSRFWSIFLIERKDESVIRLASLVVLQVVLSVESPGLGLANPIIIILVYHKNTIKQVSV
jgi:hypothetical protein